MISNVEYDIVNLSEKISGLSGALFGRGATPGDLDRVLMVETGQLGGRIGDAIGPKTQEGARKRIDRDIKQYLTVLPQYSNLDEDQQYSSYADFTWLAAGPNFLLGINDEDDQRKASGADALKMLRAGQKAGPRGKAYEFLGKHGRQSVQRLNRTRVSQSAFNSVRDSLMNKTGELRAAFYHLALKYVPTKRIPNWIREKIDRVSTNGKSQLTESLAGNNSAIELIVRASGVESNPRLIAKIQNGVKQSIPILTSKIQKILRGYKYDFENGKVFRDKSDIITLDA